MSGPASAMRHRGAQRTGVIDDMVEAVPARSGGVTTSSARIPAAAGRCSGPCETGKALGILIDQDTKVQSVFVPFFGHLASTPRAAADLALRFGCPVFVGWSRRRGPKAGDGYVLEVEPVAYDPAPADKEAEALRITADLHGTDGARHPQAPSEWVWMHRRWKTKPPESQEFPSYARLVPKALVASMVAGYRRISKGCAT